MVQGGQMRRCRRTGQTALFSRLRRQLRTQRRHLAPCRWLRPTRPSTDAPSLHRLDARRRLLALPLLRRQQLVFELVDTRGAL